MSSKDLRQCSEVLAVVPTRNASRTLRACLLSLRHQTYPVDVVVVDNHSTDTTAAIARKYSDRLIVAGPERSAQRNIGAFSGPHRAVMFIDADMVLSAGVVAAAMEKIDAGAASVVVPEVSFGDSFWAGCKSLEKKLIDGDPGIEGARVFSREAFEAVGGYNETLTACEDWDLDDRVTAMYGPPARTTEVIFHDEGQLRLRGTFQKKRYYGRWVEQYMKTAPAHRRTRGRLISKKTATLMLRQPVTAAGLVLMKLVEAAGFAAGMRDERQKATP